MQMSLFCILTMMGQSQEVVEETAESVNPIDLDPSVSSPSESAKGEHDVPVMSIEALFKIS